MEFIKEHLIYKDIPLHVCVGKLTRQEQYEFVRILIGTKKRHVTICLSHGEISDYLRQVLRALNLEERTTECLRVE
jgi:hypothetical protein